MTESKAASSSDSTSQSAAEPKPASAAGAAAAALAEQRAPARGIDLITGPEGDIMGFTVSPVAQLYAIVDQFLSTPRIIALPTEQRYAFAGKVAAIPAEHPRLIERLASGIATSITEAGALNALYILETCQELVPTFKDAMPPERLAKAAELSPHGRVQAAVLLGQKPPEWEQAAKQIAPSSIVLLAPEEDEPDLLTGAGRAVGNVTKFVGGAALGGVGLVTDTLGVTDGAEHELAHAAEDAVDLVGDGVNTVIDTLDDGINGTADDFAEKGIAGTVGDGMADAVDLVADFVGDAVQGIAGGVHAALDFLSGEDRGPVTGIVESHKVAIVVAELFGDERSLGLRIENRVVTRFTKPEAEKLGWRLGDCIIGVASGPTPTQEMMLEAISEAKEALKTKGTPIRFIIERLGSKPAGPKKGDLVFVGGRPARIQAIQPQTGVMTVQFQDDGSVAHVPGKRA